ncbi:MAG TPA: arsenate reductase (glutaredoxin) [Steroidobacteraceae bacterium]|nr:arsenate reductase (glutaredoxin) [Steroidobacteraceae bacterium]
MKEITIYHNPRCTKSRATLELLEKRGIKPRIVEYLKDTPSAADLKTIVRKLGIKPEALVRKGEDVFKQKYAGKQLTDAQWIDAMIADPILIERPIVVTEGEAAIGRPPENVVRILR